MRERPILFSVPMVRALLEGRKTQTRRVVKWRGLQPGLNLQFSGLSVERSGTNWVLTSPTRTSHEYRSVPMPCPYGKPGDRLWVRETSRAEELEGGPDGVRYAADGAFREIENTRDAAVAWMNLNNYRRGQGLAVPGIHMPRWASRITLEVTGVRVERLKGISEADAQAEGARECDFATGREVLLAGPSQRGSFVLHYRDIWEQINGAGSWDANPWVWCISFRRVA